jgi:phage-related baseplate assembly protein
MPLKVPNLDDRTYADLVQEALLMLPQYAPEWTNHNPSDPGITLIELLAYFTEMLIYRLNRVTRENKLRFLQLLRKVTPDEKKDWSNTPVSEVDEELRQTVLALRQLQRAVTGEDYEYLAKQVAGNPNEPGIIRARCFTRRNLETPDDASRARDCPGHVSVVIVPGHDLGPEALTSLLEDVRKKLEPMRLLTMRLHVVRPYYLWVSLGAMIRTYPDASFGEVQTRAMEKLQQYFSPFPGGGPDGEGWPFGRTIYLSEVYAQLEQVEGVDYIQDVRVLRLTTTGEAMDDERTAVGIQIGFRSTVGVDSRLGGDTLGDTGRLIQDALGRLMVIVLRPYELVRMVVQQNDLLPSDSPVRTQSA